MAVDLSGNTASIRTLCPQRVLPVVVLDEAAKADPMRAALVRGGLPCAEITLRTPPALEAISVLAEDPGFLVGAGTVLAARQVGEACSAGARFIVSPGFVGSVADECRTLDVPYFPGVATPTEIQHAVDSGFTELKFFPAETLGGPSALKAFAAPFAQVMFIPTGGVSATTLPSYLALPPVACVGGTWITGKALLDAEDFAGIARLAAEAVHLAAEPTTVASL